MPLPSQPPPSPTGPPQGPAGPNTTPFTTGSSIVDAFITTVIGLSMVFFGGIAYVAWYKTNVLDKIELAFTAGYDPALELANRTSKREEPLPVQHESDDIPWNKHLRRDDQDLMDDIVGGGETGRYFMLLGPKGTGKTTMLYDAMQKIHAEGVSICEAHPDLEVFRLRLGKALNYEYHEDSQTGLFQRRDPREGGPALDIERALNKLEKVALRYSEKKKRPLVLILNNIHFFKNDDDGKNILLQFQQRAEAWAASGILTVVFSSDDFWPFYLMRKTGSRMQIVSVRDLNHRQALQAAMKMRKACNRPDEPEEIYKEVVNYAGGRLAYLNKIARQPDMLRYAGELLGIEKAWLQSQIGLIPDHDDDVMDEQKWSSCSWLLLREFVKMRQGTVREIEEQIAAGEKPPEALTDLLLPKIPYYRCRQIMTRPDFLEALDRLNIISIDINHDVTPDSLLLLRAAQEVVEEEGFDQQLDDVRDRVDEIESLHRTRELTFKDVKIGDRIRLSVDKGGALLIEDERPS
ncbi:uncharacterized protein PHACADRAFT_125129 [Phanerochaete carnosa HHB-10118-sp]|uniref:Uncharacterized protein n=1 Tax=Phanerochaete carnosa (strain HHB-10118-sp) TaxID=650164 RepID=K5W3C1_PHACS|nr:uncharacterized protein PHACADRAFT_125129 [Phanerochaete carnosa HHB-10118-sp]EKM53414.1 hypothetical protein PHACADRAFT_125129 [Phanerochaete carnosa HHB-10118-sp]